ncbi:gamma-glutamyl-gamma-aminobutyrate hydrolase family protein [Alistipes ihumii]|uniref:gamma-glutamyl-gamma-aminobutyrate hydrolase family protein n=2 Tax=Alistipes ihumii TaxID=1470347 RepID=UPI003AF8692B
MKKIVLLFCLSAACCSWSLSGARPPLIGVSESCDEGRVRVTRTYVDAVQAAGGIPVVIPLMRDTADLSRLFERLDGLVLIGGGDVDPARFDAEPSAALGHVDTVRDAYDFALLDRALRRNIPVLGICRGEQLINVAFGGTLYQDLPSEYADRSVNHSQSLPSSEATHAVTVAEESLVRRITGADTLWTNSFHHQAVRDVAPGFRATARTRDGVVEAIEPLDPRIRVLGVQFHPEAHAVAGDTTMRKFFVHLVREAAREMSGSLAERKR